MQLIYRDPKKKSLQKIEIIIMLIALPLGLMWGWNAYGQWTEYMKAEKLFTEAHEMAHEGRFREAMPLLEECVKIYPEFYAAWEDMGVAYHMLREFDKSLEVYERAVEAMPENGNLRRELATAYHYNEMHEKELEAAQVAATLPNSDPLFTQRVLERAQKESTGEVEAKVDHGALDRLDPGHYEATVPPAAQGASQEQGHDHAHDHDGHDH